jgi:hypothetical protein
VYGVLQGVVKREKGDWGLGFFEEPVSPNGFLKISKKYF